MFKLCVKAGEFGKNLWRLLDYFHELPDGEKRYDIEVKEHRERRSLEANAYCFTLLDKLAEALHEPKTDIYRRLIKEIGGNNTVVCVQDRALDTLCRNWARQGLGWMTDVLESKVPGCHNVVLYYGSSVYDTKQMSRLIDLVVQECQQQDIETLTPAELAKMKADWGQRHELQQT